MQKIKNLLTLVLIIGSFGTLFAAGTTAGTTISSTATLTFGDTVDSATTIESAPDSFVVDNKIDMSVTTLDIAAVQTKPEATGVVLKFKVTNTGNNIQDYSLQALTSSTSLTFAQDTVNDNFDATVNVVVDNGDGIYNAADDTQTYIDELAPDDEVIVFIVGTMPAGLANGDASIYDLQVQAAQGGVTNTKGADITQDDSANTENPLAIQIVFADGAGSVNGEVEKDGKLSSASAYIIIIADMQIVKTSMVIQDPYNAGNNPKRIPGATIRYCYTVTNSGGADATVANIGEDLDESQFDLSTFTTNDIKIYTGVDTFNCANAANLTTTTNTGTVDTTTGVINIILNGVNANSSKSAFFDINLK